jgi:hypothetical protein
MDETTQNTTSPAAIREWLSTLTVEERTGLEDLHRRGELEAAFQRAVEKSIAARHIADICLKGLSDALRLLQPTTRGR